MLLKDQFSTVIQEALGHCRSSSYQNPVLKYPSPAGHGAAGCAISVGKGIRCARKRGICSLGGSVICYQSRGTRRGPVSAQLIGCARERRFYEQDSRE